MWCVDAIAKEANKYYISVRNFEFLFEFAVKDCCFYIPFCNGIQTEEKSTSYIFEYIYRYVYV